MPPLPPDLSEWFGPSAFLALLALLLGLQGKRIDELRADLKANGDFSLGTNLPKVL